jgi:hypothetical protein
MSDAYAIDYEHFAPMYSAHRRAIPAIANHLLKELDTRPADPLLEIGCGTASSSSLLLTFIRRKIS